MNNTQNTNSQTRQNQTTTFSLRHLLATPLLAAALLAGSVSAQDTTPSRAAFAARLGVKADALTPKTMPETYQSNPLSEERTATDSLLSRTPVAKLNSTSGVSDMVGTTSVEDFQGMQTRLYSTHESADGFRNYFNTWYTANFARRDSAVSVWQFHDFANYNYDLWTSGGSDLGIDGVRVAWHSGHGGMSSANRFFVPMGANWSNNGWNAQSLNMAMGGNYNSFGDERLRYMFWDTCNSVMVSGGHNPYSTWGVRAKGLRMVFGYETTSVDNANYGKYFWEEWNKGKSLSTAFLDASWRISTSQSPAVVAFGANSAEASDRLYNERYLYAGAAANNWGQWRWYYARSVAGGKGITLDGLQDTTMARTQARQQTLTIPTQARIQRVAPQSNSNEEVLELSRSLGIELEDSSLIQDRPLGLRAVKTNSATLVVEQNGNFEMMLEPNTDLTASDDEIADEELLTRANDLAAQLSVLQGQTYRVSMIRDTKESGGFEGFTAPERTVEKTVIIDQTIDGVPFIDPDAGHLEVTFDAHNGQATRVRSSLRRLSIAVEDNTPVTKRSVTQLRQAALQRVGPSAKANATQALEVVPETEAVGYQMIDGQAVPVYRTQVKDPNFELGRPQQVTISLVKSN